MASLKKFSLIVFIGFILVSTFASAGRVTNDVSPPHDCHLLNLKCKDTQECVAPCRAQYSAPGSCFLLPPSLGGLRHCCCEINSAKLKN
ncbi:hypothetical protein MKW92_025138 [Papaver armeniacum]|nr:hypothetical protein MKW92_025138 [Papaver armeniacum]